MEKGLETPCRGSCYLRTGVPGELGDAEEGMRGAKGDGLVAFLPTRREVFQHLNNAYIETKLISSVSGMRPSLSFPPATHPAGPCLVHADQKGSHEDCPMGSRVQYFPVPLDVLTDKIFHFLNVVVHSSVDTREVFQDV